MATLLTHLGLITFLLAAAVTSRFGFAAPIVIATGETSTVQPIGTPNLLVVKNLGFNAPLLPDGTFADFTTDLAVYQDGDEIARKTIHVNDPLVDRRLHVPPERLRAGAGHRDRGPHRRAALVAAPCR